MFRLDLIRSNFLGGVMTLMAGTAVAQAIPVAISPLLTRLYAPEELGAFALFMGVVGVLGSIACGRYELAVMLPNDDDDAVLVASLGVMVAVGLALVCFAAVMLFGPELATMLGDSEVRPLLYMVPPTVCFLGIFNSFGYLTTRGGRFALLSRANVFRSGIGAGVQVGLGLVRPGPAGLAVGYASAPFVGSLLLAARLRNLYRFRGLDWARMRGLAYKYREFPTYSVGSALAQTSLLAIVSVVISRNYTTETLGEYALVQRVLGMPLVLIAASVGQVFYQQASTAKRERGTLQPVFLATLKSLVLLAVGSAVVLYFLLPPLVPIVFGDEWSGAGEMARYMLPGFAAQFVASPLSLSNQVNMRNRFGLVGNVTVLVLVAGVLLIAVQAGLHVNHVLLAMSVTQAVYYSVFLLLIFRHVRDVSPSAEGEWSRQR